LGRSQLTIDARIAPVAGRSRIVASAHSALIDAPELSTLRAGSDDRPGGPRSDAPALSAGFDLPDADVEFRLRRLRLDRTDLEDLAFVAHTRDGRLLPVSVTGRVVGTPFAADVEMDLQALPPSASLALTAGAIDVGALLRGLGIAEDIEGHVQALNVQVLGRGSTASEWVARSGFDVRVSGGSLVVRGAARSALAEMHVGEARISAVAGEPVQARLDGEIGRIPLTVEVTSGTLAAFARDARHVPFALVARSAGTHLGLDGEVSLPLGSGGKLNLVMRGERLDTLSALARVELPAWGPWSFSSPIHMTATGYKLPSLHASVGDSRLSGSAALDLSGPRPSLDLQVVAPAIQLDDFPLPERLTDSAAKSDDDRDLRQSASRMARHTNKLLSAGFLRRLDATIDVKAKEVLSGSDRLADGAIRLTLENGRLRIDPAVVNLPAGVARVSISYEPKGSVVDLGLAVRVERFDYGILARRFDRTAHLSGLFSLDLALFGSAGSLEEIRRNASGRVDFAVWPAELSGGMFNLWSVNLLLQLLPLVDPDTRPTVNCIIGRFDLDRGDLRDDKLLIDTSAVRIRGSGHANLSTEELEFTFRPRAKGFALFRLQTPLRVSGTLGDQRFGFSRFDVVESALRLVASPILLPLERFTLGPLPRDGADVCTNPMRAGLTPAAASTAP
ncbi:MAG TPA: AsmA-like C-terminal region-containing protein, partial [Burkholderiaceae bacterium]|nr:AsmA-like C-terminal region-containing protein [Burkholderiaceae bacterium]